MQIFTDLLDKNDNKIFSDSVLLVQDKEKNIDDISEVYFIKGSFKWNKYLLAEVAGGSVVLSSLKEPLPDNWFDTIDKFKISADGDITFPDDCERIQRAVQKIFKREVSVEDCQAIWIKHSSQLMSGWVILPSNDTDLESILINHFTNKK
jgi:hypothetical protein